MNTELTSRVQQMWERFAKVDSSLAEFFLELGFHDLAGQISEDAFLAERRAREPRKRR